MATELESMSENSQSAKAAKKTILGAGLLIAENIARHISHFKGISNQLLLVTIDCNPKTTIICA